MTIFDQFRRENSNILNFNAKNSQFWHKKIMINFQGFQEFAVFGQNLDLWHTVSVYFNFQNSNWSAIFNFPFFWTPFFGFRHTKWLLVKENNENRSDIAFWKILTRNMDQYSLPTKNSQDINNKSMVENYQFFDKTYCLLSSFFR